MHGSQPAVMCSGKLCALFVSGILYARTTIQKVPNLEYYIMQHVHVSTVLRAQDATHPVRHVDAHQVELRRLGYGEPYRTELFVFPAGLYFRSKQFPGDQCITIKVSIPFRSVPVGPPEHVFVITFRFGSVPVQF